MRFAAIVGVIAALITIFCFFTGILSFPDLVKQTSQHPPSNDNSDFKSSGTVSYGTVTLSNGEYFSFPVARIVKEGGDISFYTSEVSKPRFYAPGGVFGRIYELPSSKLRAIQEVPKARREGHPLHIIFFVGKWYTESVDIHWGQCCSVLCADSAHYAKLCVTELIGGPFGRVTFEWAYQSDGSTSFSR